MKTEPFNPVVMLDSEDDIIALLQEAANDDDPAVLITALALVARNKGIGKLAEDAGLNRESLYKLGGDRKPQWDTVHKLLRALDLKLEFSSTYS